MTMVFNIMEDDRETWHVLVVTAMALLSIGILARGYVPWYVQYTVLLGAGGFSLIAGYQSRTETAAG